MFVIGAHLTCISLVACFVHNGYLFIPVVDAPQTKSKTKLYCIYIINIKAVAIVDMPVDLEI